MNIEFGGGENPRKKDYRQVDVRKIREDDIVCNCLLYTSPSPRDKRQSRMPSSA